ncbi:MAG: glycine cleavage T C-terminal barrel domain-containing protein, partial [Paracoccaceae bacterium]|nr:glycine cleavage T C-terminal barrel domain-containing protein [Paracoccaceae bacterium]
NKKKDCIGNVLSEREGLNELDGLMLVGLKQMDERIPLAAGAHLIHLNGEISPLADQGYVTSVAFSPNLQRSIGLGFLRNGGNRKGEIVRAVNPLEGEDIEVEVTTPVFVDPEGERLRA